jgi:hypothetical protein
MTQIRTRQLFGNNYNGLKNASLFLRDVISGNDSVDILIAGDSNTNYGGWGWCDGLNYALQQFGSSDYATPIVPVFSRENANFYGVNSKFDSYSYINDSETVVNAGGTGALGGTLAKGTSANSSALHALLNRASGTERPNASPFNYGYIASGDWADFIGGIYLYEGANILSWVGSALRYRVVHGVGPGMGTLRLSGRLDTAPYTSTGNQTVSCTAATAAWTTSTLSIPPNSGRNGGLYKFGYADTSGGSFQATGPVALALHSVSRSVKGHAVQSIDHYGGATTNAVALNEQGAPLVIKQYLREMRERQIACGGTGRVIAMFQGGVNGTGVSTFAGDCVTFMETIRTCWTDLGYSESDLGFIGLTSHQDNDPDTDTAIRASAALLNNNYTMVNGASLASYATLLTGSGGTSYFFNAVTERQHLTEAGYKYICGQLVTALIS